MSHDTQREFRYAAPADQGDRECILRKLRLPKSMPCGKAENVSSGKVIALLFRLDDYQREQDWAWPSKETLADELHTTLRTLQRAIKAASDAGLIVVELRKNRFGTVQNHYQIDWRELTRRAVEYTGHPETKLVPNKNKTSQSQDERSDMASGPIGHPVTTDRTSCQDRSDTLSPKPTRNPHGTNNEPTRSGGILSCVDGVAPPSPGKRDELTVADLRAVDALAPHFVYLVSRGKLKRSESHLIDFVAWAEACARNDAVANRCAVFISGVYGTMRGERPWGARITGDPEDVARRRLATAAGIELTRSESAIDAGAPARVDTDQSRREALAAITELMEGRS